MTCIKVMINDDLHDNYRIKSATVMDINAVHYKGNELREIRPNVPIEEIAFSAQLMILCKDPESRIWTVHRKLLLHNNNIYNISNMNEVLGISELSSSKKVLESIKASLKIQIDA